MSSHSFVNDCPECGWDTCLNNVSTRPPYHNMECWYCGYFSLAKTGKMTEEERLELKATMEGEEE